MNVYARIPMAKEEANLPPSQITKLAMFYLAVGLQGLAEHKKKPDLARKLTKQVRDLLDHDKLDKYGISSLYYTLAYNEARTLYSYIKPMKRIISTTIQKDTKVSLEEITVLKFALAFAGAPDSPNYLTRARQAAGKIAGSFLRNFDKVLANVEGTATEDDGAETDGSTTNVKAAYAQLAEIVGQILNKKPSLNTLDVSTEVQKKFEARSDHNADLVKKYRAAKRKISVSYDLDFISYMSKQSSESVPLQQAHADMAKKGYLTQKLPDFGKNTPLRVGVSSNKIKFYTEGGLPLATGIPAGATTVTFTKSFDPKKGTGAYLSYKAPTAAGVTRVYTEQHAKQATVNKFDKADQVNDNIDKLLVQWKRDLASKDQMKMMAATVCWLIYLTGARVGSRQNSAASMSGEKTFGIISLRPRHVKVTPTNIILTYTGKKAVAQRHVIPLKNTTEKLIAKNLAALVKGKRGDTLVFSYTNERGTEKVLSYSQLSNYLKTTGYPAGIHKLRHVRGTNLVIELLDKKKFSFSAKAGDSTPKRQKEAEDWIVKTVLEPAAVLLGHKAAGDKTLWRTTVKSYINPAPIAAWFENLQLRKPSWLPAKVEAE